VRLRRLQHGLLCGLLDAVQHCLQLGTRGIGVAHDRVQRNLHLRRPVRLGLGRAQVRFQRGHPFRRRAPFGLGGFHHPNGLGGDRTLDIGQLPAQAFRVRVVRTQPRLLRLKLPGELVLLGAQLHHRGRDRRERPGTRASTRGIQLRIRTGQVAARLHQVLTQMADLFDVGAGVHALRQPVAGAVGRDLVFLPPHLHSQLGGALFQPFGRSVHRAVLGGELVLHIDVHRVVHRRGGDDRILGGERHLDDMREAHGAGVQGRLHRDHRGVPVGIQHRSGQPHIRRLVDLHAQEPAQGVDHALAQAGRAQGVVEFRIVVEIATFGHPLGDSQALQDLGLAGHDGVGRRVGLQDALQLADLVLAGLVEQRAGRGKARGHLPDRHQGEQRHQHDAQHERHGPAPQNRNDRPNVQAVVSRCRRGRSAAGNMFGACDFGRAVEHRREGPQGRGDRTIPVRRMPHGNASGPELTSR